MRKSFKQWQRERIRYVEKQNNELERALRLAFSYITNDIDIDQTKVVMEITQTLKNNQID